MDDYIRVRVDHEPGLLVLVFRTASQGLINQLQGICHYATSTVVFALLFPSTDSKVLLKAFSGIVFSPELVHMQQPLLPFMEILPLLPDAAFSTVRWAMSCDM